jgi:hypothetical protein
LNDGGNSSLESKQLKEKKRKRKLHQKNKRIGKKKRNFSEEA